MVVLIEGRDAAGKGELIRTFTEFMNDKHFKVVALGKPSEFEKTKWYYQRYTSELPGGGQITFYNGSWYSRGLSEPAFDFCTPEQYQAFMEGVSGFEKDLVSDGIVLVKIYLSITKEEQRERYRQRKEDPRHSWKLSEKDSQKLGKWEELTALKLEVMKQSGMDGRRRWHVIRSGDHRAAVKNAIITILNSVEYPRHYKELNYVPDDDV